MTRKRSGGLQVPQVVTTKDGDVLDFKKNLVNGIPPLEVGDCFFYSPKGGGETVYLVRVRQLRGKLTCVIAINEAGEQLTLDRWIRLDRLDIVQMAARITEPPPQPLQAPAGPTHEEPELTDSE